MFYFMLATAMNTEFQQHMEHSERVLLMALWFMAFGGMVPIGNIVFGPIMDHIGPRWVLGGGAIASLALAWWCDLLRMERRGAQRATS
jgi:MFS family permease